MVLITSKKLLTNQNVQITMAIKNNSWLIDTIAKMFKDNNLEMVKRYLKVKCDEMKNYYVAHEDMVNIQMLSKTCYQLEIVKYKEL